MSDVDPVALLCRDMLRLRARELIEQVTAWAVGLSDQPHLERRHGRVRASGVTMGDRAAAQLPLGGEEDALLALGDAAPGTFRDALNALGPDGILYADRLEEAVLRPFARATCVAALERARKTDAAAWEDLLDDLGETDDADLGEVVDTGEWALPLVDECELLVLAALGDVPLAEVEAEGLTLAVVQAAESETRRAAPRIAPDEPTHDDLSGALFLAEAAVRDAALPLPVPPARADELLAALVAEGLEPPEIARVLDDLPVMAETSELVLERLDAEADGA